VRLRFNIPIARAAAAGAAFALAAGCSGAPSATSPSSPAFGPSTVGSATLRQLTVARNGAVSPIPPSLDRSIRHLAGLNVAQPDSAKAYLFVSQFAGNPVQEYHLNNRKNGPAVCSLSGTSINGIAVDPAGNLWVPNGTGGGQGYTQEYAPNCGAPLLKVTDPNGQPADVGFDRQHHVYILNIFDANGVAGSINVYDRTGSLVRSLTNSTFNELIGIATDSHNNVFVSNRDAQGNATVVEFARGKMPGKLLGGIVLGLPGAPTLDRSDNLIITDWNNYTLNVYAPPYTGAPTVTPMAGLSLWCPLDRQETHLFCADLGGTVDVYAYPSGTYAYSFNNGLSPSGFATGSATDRAAPL